MWQIPEPGMKIELINDWTFGLYWEYKNEDLIRYITGGYDFCWAKYNTLIQNVTLPKGTQLIVDTVYIRQNNKNKNSLKFRCKTLIIKKTIRFWAKLQDCKHINMKVI